MYRRSRIAFVSGDSLKLNELKGKEEEELQNEDSKTTTGNHSLQRRLTSEKDDRLSFLTGPMLCRSESREVSNLKVRMLRNIAVKQSTSKPIKRNEEEEEEKKDVVPEERTLRGTQRALGMSKSLKIRLTPDTYAEQQLEFSKKTWMSTNSLYNSTTSNKDKNESAFPDWDQLPKGLDPKYPEEEEHQIPSPAQLNSSDVLYIDSVGFEAEVRRWITKTAGIAIKELQENLQNPSTFTRFSTKKMSQVELSLDEHGSELICISKTKEIRIPLSSVSKIRVGAKTKGFDVYRSEVTSDNLAFTIVYGQNQELNLLAKYAHKVQLWLGGLIQIIPVYKGESMEYSYLSEWWDSFGKKKLSLKEIKQLLGKMKIKVSNSKLKEILFLKSKETTNLDLKSSSSGRNEKEYSFEDFMNVIHTLRFRTEFQKIFQDYAGTNSPVIRDDIILQFLKEVQCETILTSDSLSELLEPYRENPEDSHLTLDGFSEFMLSPYNHAFNRFMNEIYQDMTRPLTDYFIYSSHNTYLEGNQLSGWSSSDMYIRVLKAGCRCVELDCWNGDSGEPIIFHGHTLTTKILFEDAVRAIRDYSFVSSDFPVILSLENHCNVAQQTRMAEILLQYLGDNIAKPITGSDRKYLPSPLELKGKILIKGKVETINMNGYGPDKPEIKVKVAPELAAITYLTSTTFQNYEQFNTSRKGCWQICSFVETKLESLNPIEFVEYNKKNFSRIYPKGSRTMSSNYNPEPFWCGGSQLVALNLQTMGKIVWTNEGRFRDNGGCGYVLKPYYMLHDFSEPFDENNFKPPNPIHLTIDVLSARQLPTPKNIDGSLNPSVSIMIRGFKVDTITVNTQKVKGNGFNPLWNRTFEFDIYFPENAVLLFVIYHEIDGIKQILAGPSGLQSGKVKLAYYSLPIACLKQGYRVMDLLDEDGHKAPMTDLLCKFKIEHLDIDKVPLKSEVINSQKTKRRHTTSC